MDDAGNVSIKEYTGERVGFIGLGVMGHPMAMRLVRAGVRLVVWNRSPAAACDFEDVGALVAGDVQEVFHHARVVILMLVDEDALDAVLKRGTPGFAAMVEGRVVVSMGSNAPAYSRVLANDIEAAGGRYVEAPVSGSRKPAESGQLVLMMSGDPDVVAEVRPLIAPMSRAVVFCGPIGNALLMKLAVNLHLTTLLAGLAEAVHFADGHDLDLELLKEVIEEGPMRSDYTSAKLGKLISRDFSIQAATSDAYNISRLISKTARAAGLASPLVDLSQKLYGKSVNIGNGRQDMASVIEAFEYYALNNKLAIAQLRTCGE